MRDKAELQVVLGLPVMHRSPALAVRFPGEAERTVVGDDHGLPENLAAALETGDLSRFSLPGDVVPSRVERVGGPASPWLESLRSGGIPPSFGPETWRHVRREPAAVLEFLREELGHLDEDGKSGAPEMLICDTAGPCAECSADLAVSLANPQAVAAGAALAAAALGVKKVCFYVPWDMKGLGARLLSAVDEIPVPPEMEWTLLRGPAFIPCSRPIGVAAVAQGLMLWRAASTCGRGGPARLKPPLAVCGAFSLWRLPWLAERAAKVDELKDRRTLILCVEGCEPLWLDSPALLKVGELEPLLSGLQVKEPPKAYYLEGITNHLYPAAAEVMEIPFAARRVLALDGAFSLGEWSARLLEAAREACCGGCAPGRTAPAAVAHLLRAVREGKDGEAGMEKALELLDEAERLALCPRLGELFPAVRSCLEHFPQDFRLPLEMPGER